MMWISLVLALVAVLAIAAAAWLGHQLRRERARAHDLLYSKIDIENELDTLRSNRSDAVATRESMVAVADRLDAPLGSARAHLEEVNAQLADYRQRVRQFDAAVQYCLQPVEMIFGADKATLDQLVSHVEGARRKLFEARAALQKNPLHAATGALDGGLGEIEVLADYARALRLPDAVAVDTTPLLDVLEEQPEPDDGPR
jgi:two-component system, NtrC family, sensor kinase